MAFLEFKTISKGYPGVQALSNVSFGVDKGAVHGLMGENGAGKSTLIRVLSGDQSADEGSILIDGLEQKYSSVRDAFHAGVIVIHQELQLVPELTVAENLWLGRFPGKAGVINQLLTIPGGRHGNFTPEERTRIFSTIREFLAKNGLGSPESLARP